jgi:hypothetical protein
VHFFEFFMSDDVIAQAHLAYAYSTSDQLLTPQM